MLHPDLYKKSRVYDFFMKTLGFEHSLSRCLSELPLPYDGKIKILDAGCGTGLLGLSLLERFPEAELVATDLEPNFLKATLSKAQSRHIASSRIRVGLSDISLPKQATTLDGHAISLDNGSFHVICVGAVLGYSKDAEKTLRHLVELLAPSGTLVNLEMNEGLIGRYVSKRYLYHNISLNQMLQTLSMLGCHVTQSKLGMRNFPALLTRTVIMAQKPANPT